MNENCNSEVTRTVLPARIGRLRWACAVGSTISTFLRFLLYNKGLLLLTIYTIMKKNLLQPDTRAEILARIDNLNPNAKSQWGKMNVNQMLRHTTYGLENAMGEMEATAKSGPIKRALMRFVVLKTDIPAPKGKAETFPEFNTVENGVNPPDFNEVREQLKANINRFPTAPKYGTESPLLGKMSKQDWARLNYGHLDHHLRQFGV
jgi:hypothetical protein